MSPPFGIGLMTNERDYESHGKITFQITGEMFVTPEVLSNFIPSISHSSPSFFSGGSYLLAFYLTNTKFNWPHLNFK